MSGKLNSSLTTAEWVHGRRSSSESSSMQDRENAGHSSRPGIAVPVQSDSSQLFTKWLIKKQQANSSSENDSSGPGKQSPGGQPNLTGSIGPGGVVIGIGRGQLFPARLALALGMAKTLLGVLLVAFGALALWEQASMSYLGSGKKNPNCNISLSLNSSSFKNNASVCVQLCDMKKERDAHSTTSYFGGLISNAPLRSEEKKKEKILNFLTRFLNPSSSQSLYLVLTLTRLFFSLIIPVSS